MLNPAVLLEDSARNAAGRDAVAGGPAGPARGWSRFGNESVPTVTPGLARRPG